MEKLKKFIFQKIGLISILFFSIFVVITNVKICLAVGTILELIIFLSFLFKVKIEYENYKDTRASWQCIIVSLITIIFIIIKLS